MSNDVIKPAVSSVANSTIETSIFFIFFSDRDKITNRLGPRYQNLQTGTYGKPR
jgi:hypothetical protein